MRNSGDSDRDRVKLLDYYIANVPKDVIERNERFYLRAPTAKAECPFRQLLGSTSYRKWSKQCSRMLKLMEFHQPLLLVHATALFNAGVTEPVVQKRTGHKSSDALRLYERVNENQLQAVSNILGSTSTKSTEGIFLLKKLKRKSKQLRKSKTSYYTACCFC